MSKSNLVERWRAARATTLKIPGPHFLDNTDGRISPAAIYVALAVAVAATGGALHFKKDIKDYLCSSSFAKYIHWCGNITTAKTPMVDGNYSKNDTVAIPGSNVTAPDPYELVKPLLNDTPFLKKNGTLTLKAEDKNLTEYLMALGFGGDDAKNLVRVMHVEKFNNSGGLKKISFSSFGMTGFSNLSGLGDVKFYYVPHHNVTRLNLSAYGVSEADQTGVYAFYVGPLNVANQSTGLNHTFVSPQEAYTQILNSVNNTGVTVKTDIKQTETDPGRRNFGVLVPQSAGVVSDAAGFPQGKVVLISAIPLGDAERERILGGFRSSAGGGRGGVSGAGGMGGGEGNGGSGN